MKSRVDSVIVLLERLLTAVAVMSLAYFTYVSLQTVLYQAYENRELDAILTSAPTSSRNVPAKPDTTDAVQPKPDTTHVPLRSGSVIGRLEVPRLEISVIVRAGSDARTLRLAVGHISGTALPGELGNVGLAGHRDTFFRRLRDVRPDDEIRIVTSERTFTYRVERTDIVRAKDVWVLDPTAAPALTLVTCYPFTFIGSAPDRFIVRATQLLSPTPQSGHPTI